MKRILVTNDDGIGAEGIALLAEAVSGLGQVTVVAPDREMSAISKALSLRKPLRVERVRDGWYSLSGTPTDCVYVGVVRLLEGEVDLVVSGINRGANLGEDIHYSGTVAGASEGRILGIPAIAYSQIRGGDGVRPESLEFVTRLTEAVLERGPGSNALLNVNFPPGRARGVRLTRLGVRHYEEAVAEESDADGNPVYLIGGNEVHSEQAPDTDVQAAHDGFVSVTPLQLDLTDRSELRELADWKLFRENR